MASEFLVYSVSFDLEYTYEQSGIAAQINQFVVAMSIFNLEKGQIFSVCKKYFVHQSPTQIEKDRGLLHSCVVRSTKIEAEAEAYKKEAQEECSVLRLTLMQLE